MASNTEIATKTGMSPTGISRLRNGHRKPSFETMITIEEAYGWPQSEQIVHRAAGTWHTEFAKFVGLPESAEADPS